MRPVLVDFLEKLIFVVALDRLCLRSVMGYPLPHESGRPRCIVKALINPHTCLPVFLGLPSDGPHPPKALFMAPLARLVPLHLSLGTVAAAAVVVVEMTLMVVRGVVLITLALRLPHP